jgi:hypothetical protein
MPVENPIDARTAVPPMRTSRRVGSPSGFAEDDTLSRPFIVHLATNTGEGRCWPYRSAYGNARHARDPRREHSFDEPQKL